MQLTPSEDGKRGKKGRKAKVPSSWKAEEAIIRLIARYIQQQPTCMPGIEDDNRYMTQMHQKQNGLTTMEREKEFGK